MKENFEKCLHQVLNFEGGYVNDPDDPGGATNKGITQRVYDGYRQHHVLANADVRDISNEEVAAIYRTGYWNTCQCDDHTWPLDMCLFDAAVNSGPGHALGWMSLAKDKFKLIHGRDAAAGDVNWLCEEMIGDRKMFYEHLAARHVTLRKFLRGWLNRLSGLKTFCGL
jgi:lysozyme family protein